MFDVGGTPTVYVRSGDRFTAHAVKVRAWTDTLAVIDGVVENTLVALVDPTKDDQATDTDSTTPLPAGGTTR